MFCPNCGAQNQDAATTCNKCGFNLKGSASPKFKGTMLMMNSGGATPGAPGAPPPAAGSPAPGGPAPGGSAPGGSAPGGPAPGGPAGGLSDPKPKLKGTMIGVAPPSGGPIGSPMGGPAPGGPMGAPPGGGPMGAPPGGGGPMGGAPMGGDVNPLGGTMVANAPPGYGYGGSSPMGGQMGAPHHDAGPPATMPQAGSSGGGAPMGGGHMGGGHMGGGHMGAPGGMAPMAGGHAGGGHMGAPGGMAPMGAPGGAAPMGAHGGAGMTPYAPPTGSGMTGGKVFPEKSPVSVFFLTLVTCGIYAFFWYGGNKDAMEARGAEIGPTWHIFIPILGLIWVWKWCQGVEKVTNGQITATNALIRLWLLGAIGMAWLQSDFNSL